MAASQFMFDLSSIILETCSVEEIKSCSCVTSVTTEKSPQATPTSKDAPTLALPYLASPNLAVAPPRRGLEKSPPVPHPQGKTLTLAVEDGWEMKYADLLLKGGLGWDNSGIVVKGILARDGDRRKVVDRLARLDKGKAGSSHQWIVAVNHIKGGPILK